MVKKSGFALLLLSLSSAVNAAWQLDNSQSWLSFLSIKKQDVAELGMFKRLEGTVNDNGKAEVKIDLTSVDTNIEIRNERMQEFLFNTAEYSHAVLTAQLEMAKVNKLAIGEMIVQPLSVQLDLHGVKQDINGKVVITRLVEDRVLVASQTVLVVNAADFNLVRGIDKLRELAGLPSISKAVPVSLVLTFKLMP